MADPSTIASVLARLVGSPAERQELGRRGRAHVEQVHDARVVGRRYKELYEAVLARPRPVDAAGVLRFMLHQDQRQLAPAKARRPPSTAAPGKKGKDKARQPGVTGLVRRAGRWLRKRSRRLLGG